MREDWRPMLAKASALEKNKKMALPWKGNRLGVHVRRSRPVLSLLQSAFVHQTFKPRAKALGCLSCAILQRLSQKLSVRFTMAARCNTFVAPERNQRVPAAALLPESEARPPQLLLGQRAPSVSRTQSCPDSGWTLKISKAPARVSREHSFEERWSIWV